MSLRKNFLLVIFLIMYDENVVALDMVNAPKVTANTTPDENRIIKSFNEFGKTVNNAKTSSVESLDKHYDTFELSVLKPTKYIGQVTIISQFIKTLSSIYKIIDDGVDNINPFIARRVNGELLSIIRDRIASARVDERILKGMGRKAPNLKESGKLLEYAILKLTGKIFELRRDDRGTYLGYHGSASLVNLNNNVQSKI